MKSLVVWVAPPNSTLQRAARHIKCPAAGGVAAIGGIEPRKLAVLLEVFGRVPKYIPGFEKVFLRKMKKNSDKQVKSEGPFRPTPYP